MLDWVFEIPYVSGGRDESGADCWGLVVLFYEKEFDVNLPKYEEVLPDEATGHTTTTKGAIVIAETLDSVEEVSDPQYGDIVLLRVMGMPIHVGIVVGRNEMLHTRSSTGPLIENYTEIKWKRRVQSFHRLKM